MANYITLKMMQYAVKLIIWIIQQLINLMY